MKKLLVVLVCILGLLATTFFGVYSYLSCDIALPDVTDLTPERVVVADEDNAYTYFEQAGRVCELPEDEESFFEVLNGERSDPQYIADLLAENKQAMAALERGLKCKVCQPPEIRNVSDLPDYYPGLLDLGRLLHLSTMQARQAKQWDKATVSCCDQLRFASLVQNNPGSLIHALCGMHLLGWGLDETRKMAISPDVTEEQLRKLSEALRYLESWDESFIRAMKAEYQLNANTIDDMVSGKINLDSKQVKKGSSDESDRMPVGFLFQPNKTKKILADVFRNKIKNIPRSPAERESMDIEQQIEMELSAPTRFVSPNPLGKIFIALVVPAVESANIANDRTKIELAATRLIVACRWYEKDHGELPPSLNALVPEYLDAVQRDPYDGKPIRYDRDRAIVYSIGKDLIDQGGSSKWPADSWEASSGEEQKNPWPWEAEDAVYKINSQPDKKQETTKEAK